MACTLHAGTASKPSAAPHPASRAALQVGLANLGDASASVTVTLASGLVATELPRDEWVLVGGGASPRDLLTRKVRLNGAPLASSGGVVPPLQPRRRSNGSEPFVAPPKSIAFLRFEHVPAACAEVVSV